MSDIALSISILALVAVLGLWIGNWRIYGVGLGIGGVLFGGILVGHYVPLPSARVVPPPAVVALARARLIRPRMIAVTSAAMSMNG